ncbi:monovalent cation/H(+) antiporter subunit G [Desulfurococcus amylolyticus]|uniref:Monovalent cation/proton antiporter, MnhG/PhaG subunit n=1 Tax=Desulfurococcus amylolyticus DSM 16532 TaxID=768672 RepID=I3XSN4_DESAM|nr:monovalent cation/H(+) antiporter subunit G [Desulfurococcus amylolyticus]AFL66958.1 monovalent cation/proton antiporter, MnhG/PhaG subunit [Desulfurococcus amylolyticus DSM 16532]
MIEAVLFWLGSALLIIGGVFDFIASIGLLRFPNFYVRLHAATIGAIYGAVLPLLGVSLIALGLPELNGRFIIAGGALATAIILLIIAPVGSHILAYAAHKSKSIEWNPVYDALEEDEK